LGSLGEEHQRFAIEIDSREAKPAKSTSHQALLSLVWDNVVKLPSIARDAPNVATELRKSDDWLAVLPSAILTPAEKTWNSNI
jgi:hypothetical protein